MPSHSELTRTQGAYMHLAYMHIQYIHYVLTLSPSLPLATGFLIGLFFDKRSLAVVSNSTVPGAGEGSSSIHRGGARGRERTKRVAMN